MQTLLCMTHTNMQIHDGLWCIHSYQRMNICIYIYIHTVYELHLFLHVTFEVS